MALKCNGNGNTDRDEASSLCRVPPSPEVMAKLFAEYLRSGKPLGLSFKKYLALVGYSDTACEHRGMDDAVRRGPSTAEFLSLPTRKVEGELHVVVLLVDFPDRPGPLPRKHYEELLFSSGILPTGSMRDYYTEVSRDKVTVTGEVYGWLPMPQKYSFYTNGNSGTEWKDYPHNAPRMAEDAVNAALAAGIKFDPRADKFGEGIITALFIVHAGLGAEVLHRSIRGNHIWSHKWNLRNPVRVSQDMAASIYLTVPHDCKVGVCAHELGHLAFQWQDFYDPNYDEDGDYWDGSGAWDLMAGGSYNGNGARPAHPAALHKSQHGWVDVDDVHGTRSIAIAPITNGGNVVKVRSSKFKTGQYLLLENRTRNLFDAHLPGEGLLVWRVDETKEQEGSKDPGMALVQADGRADLNNAQDWNQGDAADPFPGSEKVTRLADVGPISTSFPGAAPSGITLENIVVDPATLTISLDINVKND